MNSTIDAPALTIDLRQTAPRERHALIFSRFDALSPGQSLELVNDHDPQPLRVQFEDRAFGRFEWRYIETGPATWRVRIGKIGTKPISDVDDSSCCSGGACCG